MASLSEPLRRLCALADASAVPRVLLVAAHPDDDVISAGGRLAALGPHSHVVYVSDGAPRARTFYEQAGFSSREQYAAARRKEALAALELAGVLESATHELRATDQEVALALPRLVREAVELIARVEPDLVLTHSYEGGHPDHDATALVVHAAAELTARKRGRRVALAEFASYHVQGGELSFGTFLPARGAQELTLQLGAQELEHKLAMLQCHATQQAMWRLFPCGTERFRDAPAYDFKRAPAAAFFYDGVDWGVRGQEFLELSRAALAEFGIEGSC